jgi:hypothetical protein
MGVGLTGQKHEADKPALGIWKYTKGRYDILLTPYSEVTEGVIDMSTEYGRPFVLLSSPSMVESIVSIEQSVKTPW